MNVLAAYYHRIVAAPARVKEPPKSRVLAIVGAVLLINAGIMALARVTAADLFSPSGLLVAVVGGVISTLLIGSTGEWLVHRFIMHRRFRFNFLNVPFELHHKGHHYIHFTPEKYVHEGTINYIPVYPLRPNELCTSRTSRLMSMGAQGIFYVVIAAIFTYLPAWFATGNPLFTAIFVAGGLAECFMFVRFHDVVHYPGHSYFEKFRWFRFLDHHHYIHHIDPRANTNFLLPLGDILFGTFRASLTEAEAARWPSFEEARARLITQEEANAWRGDGNGHRQEPSEVSWDDLSEIAEAG